MIHKRKKRYGEIVMKDESPILKTGDYAYIKAPITVGHGTPLVEYDKGIIEESIKNVLGVQRLSEDVILPEIKAGNAGIDLRVLTPNGTAVVIEPNGTYKFNTGIKLNIPDGYYVEVVPRSSTGVKKEIELMNTVGVIDSTYKGEILVFVRYSGKTEAIIENNERLCQMIIHKDEASNFVIKEVNDVGTSERGEGGFGSSGRF